MERAALSLAVSVVSPIFSMLGDEAAPYFGGDITEEELQHLQNIILPKIRTVLRVAEAVPVHELKPWLRTLQAAAYEAEDVLDMYEYKYLQAQVSSLLDPLKKLKQKAKDFFSPLSLKTELRKSMEKLRQSANEADKLISLYGTISQTPLLEDIIQQQQRRQQPPTVSSPSSPIFGRDEEREYLVNMLIPTTNEHSSSERCTPILAIYGIGGAGKSTLAQSVYNDSRVEKHFHTRMWVHVSRKFDACEVTMKIIESATKGGESSKEITSLSVLQTKVEEILESKKFLVVFDDVWCEDCWEWDQMLIPLNKVGGTESRILVTTRTQEIASILRIKNVVPLEDLEDKHYMSIFKHYSLGDANKVIFDKEKAMIANHIVMKIKSPLSARIVGSLLWGEKSVADWKQILKEDKMSKDTLDVLYLSFENLAPHLRRCFAFCSLYPKGYHFKQQEVDRLVKFWIAQDFVEVSDDDNMTIEDKGMQYFNELVSHSFFQKETNSYGGFHYYHYVIHDLLHDLAEGVSKDHCFRIEDDTLRIPTTTVMHLSIFCKKDLSSNINSEILKLLNLRTFIIDKISKADFNNIFDARSKIFDMLKKLRVLHLGYHRLSELHKSVGQLKHLRYFHLEEVDRLPDSLGKLYHLQSFNTQPIEKLPENLNNLINLRHAGHEIISKIPFSGRLTSLQNLAWFEASRKAGHGVGQLKNLRELQGSLCIYNLENVKNKAEASEASLNEKKLLERLSLGWSTNTPERDSRMDEEVIDGLEPSPNLNELKIRGYNGVELPKWLLNDGGVSSPQFSRLSTLSIVWCPKLKQVRSLPSTLKTVVIERCENLCEASSLPPDLRDLTVIDCPKLMQLCPFPPNLEHLYIEGCPGVETLLADVLLFDSRDEQQPNHQLQQQQEKDDRQQHLQLKMLSIKRCSVSGGKKRHLGSWNNKLFSSLSKLELHNLPWLASLLLPPDLTSLESVSILECENVELFGSSLASASSLKTLQVVGCPKLIVEGGEPLLLPPSLTHITIEDLSPLRRSPCLNSLSDLTIKNCREGLIASTREQEELFPHLTDLYIEDCPNMTSLPASLEKLSSLMWLRINGCPKIESLPNLPASLYYLEIKECPKIESLPNLPATLRDLFIVGCPKIESLPNLPASLEDLSIRGCPEIESLPNLPASLDSLSIEECPKIESLPNLPASLKLLEIGGCHPQLKESCGEGGPLHHKVRHIRHLHISQ